jgi:hypothetical protein
MSLPRQPAIAMIVTGKNSGSRLDGAGAKLHPAPCRWAVFFACETHWKTILKYTKL